MEDRTAITLLDGKPRTLRYTIAGVRRLKARFNQSILSPAGGLKDLDEETLPVLIAEGLCEEDGSRTTLKPDEIAELMDMRTFKAVLDAFGAAFGFEKKEPASPQPESIPTVAP